MSPQLPVDLPTPGGGGFPPVPCVSPLALPASALVPVAQQLPCGPLGSGMGWDGSVETLEEHEADASREGEWGICPAWGPGSAHPSIHSFDNGPLLSAR